VASSIPYRHKLDQVGFYKVLSGRFAYKRPARIVTQGSEMARIPQGKSVDPGRGLNKRQMVGTMGYSVGMDLT